LDDFSSESEIENRTIICGSLTSSMSSEFAVRASRNSQLALTPTLEINGDLIDGDAIEVKSGSVAVSCNTNRSISNVTFPIEYSINNRIVKIAGGNDGAKVYRDCSVSERCTRITKEMHDLSNALASQSATDGNTVDIPPGRAGSLIFHVNSTNCNGIAVFHLSADLVISNPAIESIVVVTSLMKRPPIVINLFGETVSLRAGVLVLDSIWANLFDNTAIIWNFYDATKLELESPLPGILLAPLAQVTTTNRLAGSIAVKSLVTKGKVHLSSARIPSCI
jgi:choice-of-anchor A domain-containing protein